MDADECGTSAVTPDGNAADGILREVFAFDAASVTLTCGQCGAIGPVGTTSLDGGSLSKVLRCSHCATAILRVIRTPRGLWLEMESIRSLMVRFDGVD